MDWGNNPRSPHSVTPDLPSEARADRTQRSPHSLTSSPRGAALRLVARRCAGASGHRDRGARRRTTAGARRPAARIPRRRRRPDRRRTASASPPSPRTPRAPSTRSRPRSTTAPPSTPSAAAGCATHEGQDMFAPEGTPEISPEATEVLETGTDGGRGNWAALYEPRSKRTFVYMHMLEPASVEGGPEAGGRRPGRPARLHRLLRRRAPALRDPRGQGSVRRADRPPARAAALGSVHRRLTRHTMAG